MTIVATEGFDMYNGTGANTGASARWDFTGTGGGGNVVMTAGRFGGQSLIFTAGSGGAQGRLALPSTYMAFGHGFAFKFDNTSNFNAACNLRTVAGATVVLLGINTSTGVLTVTGPSGTIATASGLPITTVGVWHYFEVYGTVNAVTGTCQVYLDGVQIVNVINVNTGSTAVQNLFYQGVAQPLFYIDDIFFSDVVTRVGECRVETLRPNGDSSVTWTPNSGSNNYSRVNETLVDGDTSYVSTASTGVRDLYTLGALSSTPANIYAVNVVFFGEKTDATTRQMYGSIRSNTTDSDGPLFNLAANYSRFDRVVANDPATSAAWTASGVNNLKIGPKAA
jgi:hypothetical protein